MSRLRDRDAHVLGQAARRRRARARASPRRLAARGHARRAGRARAAPARSSSARRPSRPTSSGMRRTRTRRSTIASAAMIDAYRDGLRPLAARRPASTSSTPRTACRPTPRSRCATRASSPHVVRTVHHVDDFRSPSLDRLPGALDPSIPTACCASRRPWVAPAARASSASRPASSPTASTATASRPPRDAAERAADREALRLGERLCVLTVGGIEPRKGSLDAARGASRGCGAPRRERDPLLVIAGGATLFDYRDEIDRFGARAARARRRRRRAHARRPLDDELVARAYRAADVLRVPVDQGGLRARRRSRRSPPACRWSRRTSTSSATFLADGENALLVPVGDRAALAAALLRGRHRSRARGAPACRPARRSPRATAGTRSAEAHEPAYAALVGTRPDRGGSLSGAACHRDVAAAATAPTSPPAATRCASTSRPRSGGTDTGLMPTELFCAALASCFCLAVAHVARKRSIELPDLQVTATAERAGPRAALRPAHASRPWRTSTTRCSRRSSSGPSRSAGSRTRSRPGRPWSIVHALHDTSIHRSKSRP